MDRVEGEQHVAQRDAHERTRELRRLVRVGVGARARVEARVGARVRVGARARARARTRARVGARARARVGARVMVRVSCVTFRPSGVSTKNFSPSKVPVMGSFSSTPG